MICFVFFFLFPFKKATIFHRQNQTVNHFFLGTSSPQRQQGMHSSSSTFGSLQLHSDMESCAGHLQNQTCSHSKAGSRWREERLWNAQDLSQLAWYLRLKRQNTAEARLEREKGKEGNTTLPPQHEQAGLPPVEITQYLESNASSKR